MSCCACRLSAGCDALAASTHTPEVVRHSTRFYQLLTEPNASRHLWLDPAHVTRTRRYFCCGNSGRAYHGCTSLTLPRDGESWPICEDWSSQHGQPLHRSGRRKHNSAHTTEASYNSSCLVYSFGIGGQWGFDDQHADRGCEVHSFDPTGGSLFEKHSAHVHTNVHFHPWGLASALPCARKDSLLNTRASDGKSSYGALIAGHLFSLDEIVRRLGHEGRRISILKVDCEGCEWDALHHVAYASPVLLNAVDEIMIEFHLDLKQETDADLIRFATTFELLFVQQQFRLWWWHENGLRRYRDVKPASKKEGLRSLALRGPAFPPYAFEIGLRRRARPSSAASHLRIVSGGSACGQCPGPCVLPSA